MAFYLQLLTNAFNQAHTNGKFSAEDLHKLLNQLGFDSELSSSVKSKVLLSFRDSRGATAAGSGVGELSIIWC